jgi:hypothetical protein
MDELNHLFLNESSIQTLFTYLCKSSSHSVDIVTDTLRVMLTTPVEFSVGKYGLSFFKGHPVLPFFYMTPPQRQYLYELMSALSTGRPEEHHTAFACIDNPMSYVFDNERVVFKAGPTLDQSLVMRVLKNCVGCKPLLLSILLQRLSGYVLLKRDVLAEL